MTAIESLTRAIERIPGVRLAVLFGSAARGDPSTDSDIDIGVSMNDGSDCSPTLRVALERATGRTIDLVCLDLAPPLLRFEIARDGVVLVSREPHDWPEFRAHAMIDWWDWAPTARMMHQTMTARLKAEAEHGSS
jgi:predicted nucleotidyltransferase